MATRVEAGGRGGFDAVRWFRLGALLMAALVVVQAGLAGRYFFFGKHVFLTIHENVANALFLIAVVTAWFAWSGQRRGRLDRFDVGLAGALVVLISAQIMLGYGGQDSALAASLHWPNGVLICAVTALLLGRTLPRQSTADR